MLLLSLPLALSTGSIVLDVKDGISRACALLSTLVLALCVDELLPKGLVVALLGALLDDNFRVVVR